MNTIEKKRLLTPHILFLTNITLLPVISFVVLVSLYKKTMTDNNFLLKQHYHQSILANIVAGILLLIVSGLVLTIGRFDSIYTWMWLIIYFTCIHSVLILFGVFALIKANNNQLYIYPIFGKLWL